MLKTVDDWMQEGEELYTATMSDCRDMESQVAEAQKRLAEKQGEANRIARAIGKPNSTVAAVAPAAMVATADTVAPATSAVEKTSGGHRLRIAGWTAAILGTAGILVWLIASGYRP